MSRERVERYVKAADLDGALAAKLSDPAAQWLSGGTVLLAGDRRDKPESVIDIGSALGREIERGEGEFRIGAGATFQDIAESKAVPGCLAEAALTMVNRNTRNRATLGGNLGADKSCSSLIPILIALEAEVEVVSPSSPTPARVALGAWLAGRETQSSAESARAADLALRVRVPMHASRRAAYRRWNRVSCDLSVLGAAVAFDIEGDRVHALRIALGGLGPKARRFPGLEALFEGKPLPSREEIEAAVAPLLEPIDDLRASAAFKRLRGSQLVADALIDASTSGDTVEARP
jgi:probable selenate reductase FAD-binding subunit